MVISSLLDTDLYKLTMQACILKHFKDADVEYLLHNRSNAVLSLEAIEWVKNEIKSWSNLRLTDDELAFLKQHLPFLCDEYFEFAKNLRINPEKEVEITVENPESEKPELKVTVRGKWQNVMWYEVPLLAVISEAYFKFVENDWNMEGQYERAKQKAEELIANDCPFSEFGSRRRRSHETHEVIIKAIIDGAKGSPLFVGTSNVAMAKKFNLKPIGTVAHELVMGIAAYTDDYINANQRTMELWIDTVGPEHAGVALTDTFGTGLFLRDFKPPFSDIYTGVRHDSGDPEEFTKIIAQHYKKLGYKPFSKKLVYSDSLTVKKCLRFKKYAIDNELVPSFGIGTFFTNDFYHTSRPEVKSAPLNIVMKLDTVNGQHVVKLSDNKGKHTGDEAEIERCKRIVDYVYSSEPIDEANRWTSF
ncbi:nicotinate phosphoribosyltransferase [Starmerella bacillaris]|uniref:Nicotinate phosphoribosyltransferase n=1 Tax=Starmerella bacillaris TaxID=1247836 RepID=A0AAV5RKJ9_STABA|nr:nicotinate phosphoribosyltransferase [Starmerella bacillaris]